MRGRVPRPLRDFVYLLESMCLPGAIMKYDLFGPWELPRLAAGRFDRSPKALREFWEDVDEEFPDLSHACGCYIISVRNKAWYVGMCQAQDFRHECFTADKVLKIQDAMDGGNGVPYLLLIARQTPTGKFSKPSTNGYSDIAELELLLIGAALERNPELLNKSATKILREMVVPGFINSPKHSGNRTPVREFWKIMGM